MLPKAAVLDSCLSTLLLLLVSKTAKKAPQKAEMKKEAKSMSPSRVYWFYFDKRNLTKQENARLFFTFILKLLFFICCEKATPLLFFCFVWQLNLINCTNYFFLLLNRFIICLKFIEVSTTISPTHHSFIPPLPLRQPQTLLPRQVVQPSTSSYIQRTTYPANDSALIHAYITI